MMNIRVMPLQSWLVPLVLLSAACGGTSSLDAPSASADAGTDAGDDADSDATSPDAAILADAQAMPDADDAGDLLAPCSASRDVFHIDVTGPQGVFQRGAQTFTNLGATWLVTYSPSLSVDVFNGSTGGDLQVDTSGSPLVPGVYPQRSGGPPPWLDVAIGGEGCLITTGTFTLVDFQTTPSDGASPVVQSLALTFDLVCQGQAILRGCVRYAP